LLAAVNEASRKIDEQVASQMGSLAGGLNLPGFGF
jgi:DNA-binding protein YbaB